MIHLRPFRESDRAYVIKSWLEGYKDSKEARAAGASYYPGHRGIIERLLEHAACTVAYWLDDDDTILGFAVTGPGAVVHWVCVRGKEWEGKGVAKSLLAPFLGKPCRVTHLPPRPKVVMAETSSGARARPQPLPDQWVYDPYARRV